MDTMTLGMKTVMFKKVDGNPQHGLTLSGHKRRLGYYVGMCILLTFIWVDRGIAQTKKTQTPIPWPTSTWSEASPESVGMDGAGIKNAEQMYPQIFPSGYSLLIIKNGQLVSESYFNGQTVDTNNHIFSVTKTFVATLVGVAIKQGWIKSVDQRVADLLPEYQIHPDLADLTLKDVLTHRSGVASRQEFMDIGILLKAKPKVTPGTTFEYSNYAPSLLTAILDRKAKQDGNGTVSDVSTMAENYLFDPLGIDISEWRKGPDGVPEGGNGLHMTARDMARLGYLLLRDGHWEDKQVLPEDWVQEASKYQVGFDRQKGYGYLNWVRRLPDKVNTSQGEQDVQGYFAYGHRGQYIGVYPKLDLLVVTTADATDATRDTFFVPDLLHDFVRRFIFSAIETNGSTSGE
ncbi:serine hydrolase domain-containing protein [Allomuricauda sp. F6463D]|uniref:serine hydrolase domain-containing protein n=1 Tax=Allomuricauda sp. F6463D TaxID=2926409 RepID=UPI001FF2CE6D|nr:serine hydrolase [Muricauda sp. F6463D]MCK0159206.1 beta-lactamase family protein [Muricauda sp. F6463D]